MRSRFTGDKVRQIRKGMRLSEVLELFGPPSEVQPFDAGGMRGQKYLYHVGGGATDVNAFFFDFSQSEPLLVEWFIGRTA